MRSTFQKAAATGLWSCCCLLVVQSHVQPGKRERQPLLLPLPKEAFQEAHLLHGHTMLVTELGACGGTRHVVPDPLDGSCCLSARTRRQFQLLQWWPRSCLLTTRKDLSDSFLHLVDREGAGSPRHFAQLRNGWLHFRESCHLQNRYLSQQFRLGVFESRRIPWKCFHLWWMVSSGLFPWTSEFHTSVCYRSKIGLFPGLCHHLVSYTVAGSHQPRRMLMNWPFDRMVDWWSVQYCFPENQRINTAFGVIHEILWFPSNFSIRSNSSPEDHWLVSTFHIEFLWSLSKPQSWPHSPDLPNALAQWFHTASLLHASLQIVGKDHLHRNLHYGYGCQYGLSSIFGLLMAA